MGSVFDKEQTENKQQKRRVKSKGDRLGWTPYNEVVHKPLRESLNKGEVVQASYCYMSCAYKLVP